MQRFHRSVTLIELILVMVILVLITGLTVTLYPNLRAQARIVNTIATIDELDKAIRTYEALEGEFPDEFDSLLLTGGGLVLLRPSLDGAGLILPSSLGSIATTLAGGITPADVEAALGAVGLSVVIDNTPATAPAIPSATFDFVTLETILGATPTAVALLSATAPAAYGITTPATGTFVYLVLGLGDDVTFVGATPGISSAPLNESYVESENDYDLYYGRYLAIFEIKSTTTGVIDPIRFVKVVSPSALPGGLGGTIENYKTVYDSF